jgi:tyrosyl-tRNA synthetase
VINIIDEPNDMFGKVMSIRDELISQYALLCTNISEETIAENDRRTKTGEVNPRDVKLELATEIVNIYHGRKKAQRARVEFIKVFTMKELPEKIETKFLGEKDYEITRLLVETKMAPSRSEAKRLIIQGGVKFDGKRVLDDGKIIRITLKPTLLQVGKRRFIEVRLKSVT